MKLIVHPILLYYIILYYITSAPNISSYQDPTVGCSEFSHDLISLLLIHIWMHTTNRKVILSHFISEPLNLTLYKIIPTLALVLQNITAYVMVSVSYKSHNVSNFHSSLSTWMKNYLIPSRVNSSLLTKILIGLFMNLLVMSRISYGRVADTTKF